METRETPDATADVAAEPATPAWKGDGPPLSGPKDLQQYVRKFGPVPFLETIHEVAVQEGANSKIGRMFPGPNARENVFTPWGLAHLARYVTAETIANVAPYLTCTRSDFIARVKTETAAHSDERQDHWAFNPLQGTPLVRVPGTETQYVVPVPRLLLERLADAPYHVLLSADGEAFTVPFGYVFEAYVGMLLEPYVGARLRREITYKEREKTSDWLVIDDDAAALIECKTGRLPKAVKTTASAEDVARAVTRGYGGAMVQLKRVVDDVHAGVKGLEELAGRELLPMIVLLDPVYMANGPLWEPFRRQAKTERGVPEDFEAQICSVHALERLAPGLATKPLSEVLREKLAGQERDWDWETYVGRFSAKENPVLIERYEKFLRPLDDHLGEKADAARR